ncbi:ATP/GTP-binding protein [Kitasatospora sp. NPDC094015]|uniref:GTP-binding protein n=1 Tax=Kitasatospora sp. NPDC094015 TaxID=3155205 RepID=UPI0033256600
MAFAPSPETRPAAAPRPPLPLPLPLPVKIVIAGGPGAGKSTAVASISDSTPLTTEAVMTTLAAGVDGAGRPPGPGAATVAMDFGSVTLDGTLKLYLFGTPGQDRSGFLWDDLVLGALGALVVVDRDRLIDGYPAVDHLERAGLPYVVGVNRFGGRQPHAPEEIRRALAVADGVPVLSFDARDRLSVRDALLAVLNRALDRAGQPR